MSHRDLFFHQGYHEKITKMAFFLYGGHKKVDVLILGPTDRTGPGPYYGFLYMVVSIVYCPKISPWVLHLDLRKKKDVIFWAVLDLTVFFLSPRTHCIWQLHE